jgi:hypothetical protein
MHDQYQLAVELLGYEAVVWNSVSFSEWSQLGPMSSDHAHGWARRRRFLGQRIPIKYHLSRLVFDGYLVADNRRRDQPTNYTATAKVCAYGERIFGGLKSDTKSQGLFFRGYEDGGLSPDDYY